MSTPLFVSLFGFTALTLVGCVLAASPKPALGQEKKAASDFDRLEKQDEPLHLNPFNNVLDETQILPMRVSTTGEHINYRLQSPREFIVTSKFDF